MKKVFLSVGAMMLSGFVLASCSFINNGGIKKLSIKKPEDKGNAIDELDIDVSNSKGYFDYDDDKHININKDDSFDTIIKAIKDYEINNECNDRYVAGESSYQGSYKRNMSVQDNIKAKNYIDNNTYYKDYSSSLKSIETTEEYQNRKSVLGESFNRNAYVDKKINSNSKIKKDGHSIDESTQSVTTAAGNYNVKTYSNEYRMVSIGIYESVKTSSSNNSDLGKITNGENTKTYMFVDKNESSNENNYNATYTGTYKDKIFSYKLEDMDDYLSSERINFNFYEYFYGIIVNFNDYYDCSFELTDKYIILTGTSTFSNLAYTYANRLYGDTASDEEISQLTKSYLDNEFKGTKTSFEIWIKHSKLDQDTNKYELEYSYGKSDSTLKMNFKEQYTRSFLDFYRQLSDQDKRKASSSEFKISRTKKISMEFGVPDDIYDAYDTYDTKIKEFKEKAKKNNIFDKMTMTIENN